MLRILKLPISKIFGINGLVHKFFGLFEHILWRLIPYEYRPAQIYYEIICRIYYKFNKIKIKSLPYTWSDPDDLIVGAVFQIFVDFIELEKPLEFIDTEHEFHKESWDKIKDLYAWVKDFSNKEQRLVDEWTEHCKIDAKDHERGKEILQKEDDLYEQATKVAAQVVSLRANLWV